MAVDIVLARTMTVGKHALTDTTRIPFQIAVATLTTRTMVHQWARSSMIAPSGKLRATLHDLDGWEAPTHHLIRVVGDTR